MMDLCFIDTETTSLSASTGEIWEFAGIRVNAETGKETVANFQIECDLGSADPYSLKIGKYHERYFRSGVWDPYLFTDGAGNTAKAGFPKNGELVTSKSDAAALIEQFTRDASLVGNCVSFDSERMERLLRNNFQCPGWHYHVIDMEPIVVGYAKAKGKKFDIPYLSSELTEWLGVEPPNAAELHTALGDARWVQRLWEKVFA